MKSALLGYLPCALTALGLAAFGFFLKSETDAHRRTIETLAVRDLADRTKIAIESIGPAIETGDFVRLHEFASAHHSDQLRLTVLAEPGGMIFDSESAATGTRVDRPEIRDSREHEIGTSIRPSQTTGKCMLYCARRTGGNFIVRLGVPYDTIVAPIKRNRPAMILSGLIGASSILLVLLFTMRLISHNRKLARERDAKARLLTEMQRVADFRRDFIANVSHEIKTPLTGILGATELLTAGDELSADDRAELLALLRRESTRLDSLAHDILSLARLERDEETGTHHFAPTELADVLATATDRVRHQIEKAGMRLTINSTPSLVVPCDARLVEQALVNLVINAVRHSGSPDVTISLTPIPGGAEFSVSDHGVGLHATDRDRIFERFYRVDKAHSRETGGTGLGLAIVKHTAHLHGGDASVMSEPGHGCTFTFTLKTQQQNKSQERKIT